jgi:hypothetical protein
MVAGMSLVGGGEELISVCVWWVQQGRGARAVKFVTFVGLLSDDENYTNFRPLFSPHRRYIFFIGLAKKLTEVRLADGSNMFSCSVGKTKKTLGTNILVNKQTLGTNCFLTTS